MATAATSAELATIATQVEEVAQTPAGVALLSSLSALALQYEQQFATEFHTVGMSIFAALENEVSSIEQSLLKTNATASKLWGNLANVLARKPVPPTA